MEGKIFIAKKVSKGNVVILPKKGGETEQFLPTELSC